MKKKIISGSTVLAIAAVAAWNVNLNSQKSDLSDVSLANVEALADEIGDRTDGACHNSSNQFCTIYTIYSNGGASASTYMDAWYN